MDGMRDVLCSVLGATSSLYSLWLLWDCWRQAKFQGASVVSPARNSASSRANCLCQFLLALVALGAGLTFLVGHGREISSLFAKTNSDYQRSPVLTNVGSMPPRSRVALDRDSTQAGQPIIGIDCAVTSLSDVEVACLLRSAPKLDWLNLAWTPVTLNVLRELRHTPRLTSLNLRRTQIGNDGLEYLGELKSLHWLSLDATRVTDAGLPYLSELSSLEILDLRDTATTEEGVRRLEKALPNCTIQHSCNED